MSNFPSYWPDPEAFKSITSVFQQNHVLSHPSLFDSGRVLPKSIQRGMKAYESAQVMAAKLFQELTMEPRSKGHGLAGLKPVQDMVEKAKEELDSSEDHSLSYGLAELTDARMLGHIKRAVFETEHHIVGDRGDNRYKVRLKTGRKGSEGTTGLDNWMELHGPSSYFNQKTEIDPGAWRIRKVYVCKNEDRWSRYTLCRERFLSSGLDATSKLISIPWSDKKAAKTWMRIDDRIGECFLWAGLDPEATQYTLGHGFRRLHAREGKGGYGMLGRGNYFTDKFSKSMMYAMNLYTQYFGMRLWDTVDVRMVTLSRVLLGAPRFVQPDRTGWLNHAHNMELTALAQTGVRTLSSTKSLEDAHRMVLRKLDRGQVTRGWRKDYEITGKSLPENYGHESLVCPASPSRQANEMLVAIGKQCYPEFLIFVEKIP